MVNVPQAVWIDEAGQIVRPAEVAGAYEGFRALDFKTMTMPEDVTATVKAARATYVAAVRDWAENGAHSAHVLFRLGLYLRESGEEDEGRALLAQASDLHPEAWTIWRQTADKLDNGLAAGPDFWQRVSALGDRHFYPPPDMAGMPTDGPPAVQGT